MSTKERLEQELRDREREVSNVKRRLEMLDEPVNALAAEIHDLICPEFCSLGCLGWGNIHFDLCSPSLQGEMNGWRITQEEVNYKYFTMARKLLQNNEIPCNVEEIRSVVRGLKVAISEIKKDHNKFKVEQ